MIEGEGRERAGEGDPMSTEGLLDHLLVPRPNGSEGLLEVASFIEATLRAYAPEVEIHTFTATPYGFQLLFATTLLLMLGFAAAISLGRYGLALLLAASASALLLVETELLWSPVSTRRCPRLSEHAMWATLPPGIPTRLPKRPGDGPSFGNSRDAGLPQMAQISGSAGLESFAVALPTAPISVCHLV